MKHHYTFLTRLAIVAGIAFPVYTSAQTALALDSAKSVATATPTANARVGALFAGDEVIEFTLTCALRSMLKDRGNTPAEHPVLLTYSDAGGQSVALPITVKTRGNFRRKSSNCAYPPLLLDFPKKKTRNALFAGHNKLKLVTHCQTEEYVVREYLVYKLYNLLTDVSFRARLARVTYIDSIGKRGPETHWAFLLEDEDAMAKRNGATINNGKQMNMGYLDSLNMATVAVFEYLIGNTDWSVPYLHNIRLLSVTDNGDRLAVAYDFDHAGIVDAQYALPAEQLAIKSVRERLYRGLPYSITIFQKVFDRFNQMKPQVYALYASETRLSPGYVKRTLKFLDDFYTIINKPALVRAEFLQGDRSGTANKGVK